MDREKPPAITEPWLDAWRSALEQLKEQGSWVVAQRPMLDQYAFALRAADWAMEAGDAQIEWDKHSKRALAFAEALGLTAKARKVLAVKAKAADSGEPPDPFEALDELASRRRRAS